MSKTYHCSQITKGKVDSAPALVSKDAICFYLVEPETGVVKERNHDAFGKSVVGKVLIMPSGKGSSVVQLDGLYKLMMPFWWRRRRPWRCPWSTGWTRSSSPTWKAA